MSLKSEPRRNSLLVGVCDDEDGEEEEEENKMAAWMGVSLQRGLGVRRRKGVVIGNGMAGNGGGLAQRRTRGVNSSMPMSMSRVLSVLLTTSVSAV